MSNEVSSVRQSMAAINRSWRENRPKEMGPYLHPDITMILPGFTGVITGRDALLASFVEFCSGARVLDYEESDEQIQVIGDSAFVSYRFMMVYERPSYREKSTGRDIWAFQKQEGHWLAVWRTMVDLRGEREEPAITHH
jgi:hypothetical protein